MTKEETIQKIEDGVVDELADFSSVKEIDSLAIETTIEWKIKQYFKDFEYSLEERSCIQKKIEARLIHLAEYSCDIFESENYKPWFLEVKSKRNLLYWNRYKKYLIKEKGFHLKTVTSIDNITDTIIDHVEDPFKEGAWKRKGMVVGHVQSGKTANYIGVVAKAADCGYKVIIVLGGHLNSLRNQTQERIELGFIGKYTDGRHKGAAIGVGLVKSPNKIIAPISLTTRTKDFTKSIADQSSTALESLNGPVIIVIKKNSSSLKNLIEWLTLNNRQDLKKFPMLLIDDESDYASVNTNKTDQDPTVINAKICELLEIFDRRSYLAYTATPFANIFIDSDNPNDLFPEDFILTLESPENYIGPDKLFLSVADNKSSTRIIDIEDAEVLSKYKKNSCIETLPDSLIEAISLFLLAKAIRLVRKHIKQHHSMMINVTIFKDGQGDVRALVEEVLLNFKNAIGSHSLLASEKALRNKVMRNFKTLFDREYVDVGCEWGEVLKHLNEAVCRVEVLEVNTSKRAKKSPPLDYSSVQYPEGRSVILVGGFSLSRGLTIEGLVVSYFLRNSMMYDTLMQMGRWFGYRPSYEDLCRVYMSEEASSWYSHIAGVLVELREEFQRMQNAKMTPKDFGLCIRAHPTSLIVTAKNKMRLAKEVPFEISLEGRLVETACISSDDSSLSYNFNVLSDFVKKLNNHHEGKKIDSPSGYLWSEIDAALVCGFIENFKNHPLACLTQPKPLLTHIQTMLNDEIFNWDVFIVSPNNNEKAIQVGDMQITPQVRTLSRKGDALLVNKEKRRVGYASLEKAGIPDKLLSLSTELSSKHSGSFYRKIRAEHKCNPLLILHVVNEKIEKGELRENRIEKIVAYGLSFPGTPGSRLPEYRVSYMVNLTKWKEYCAQERELGDEDYE